MAGATPAMAMTERFSLALRRSIRAGIFNKERNSNYSLAGLEPPAERGLESPESHNRAIGNKTADVLNAGVERIHAYHRQEPKAQAGAKNHKEREVRVTFKTYTKARYVGEKHPEFSFGWLYRGLFLVFKNGVLFSSRGKQWQSGLDNWEFEE